MSAGQILRFNLKSTYKKVFKVLNGWQRIWLVLGVVSLLLSGVFLIGKIPSESDIYHSWVSETIELTLTLDEFENLSIWDVRKAYSHISDEIIIQKVQGKFSNSNEGYSLNFADVNKKYETRLHNLFKSQALILFRFLGAWIIVMLAIYVFGWSIGWIARGFRTEKVR